MFSPAVVHANGDSHHPHLKYSDQDKTAEAAVDLPEDYVYKDIPHYRFYYKSGTDRLIEPLIARAPGVRKEFVEILGVDPPGVTRVYIAGTRRDFQRMQPGGNKMPSWVAGVAYGKLGIVVLQFAGRQGPIDVAETFDHEMSHILLRAVLGDAPIPTWFVEGLAQWQAKQFQLDRIKRLWEAMFAGRLIPLEELMRNFPSAPSRVSLAYDESFEFINFLIGEYGHERFHKLVQELASQHDFKEALESAYNIPLENLELEWRSSLKMSYGWIPLITSGASVWTLASVLFLIGYFKRRRDKSRKMAKWEQEENERDQLLISINDLESDGNDDGGSGKSTTSKPDEDGPKGYLH